CRILAVGACSAKAPSCFGLLTATVLLRCYAGNGCWTNSWGRRRRRHRRMWTRTCPLRKVKKPRPCAQGWNSIARNPAATSAIDPIGLALENFDAIGRWRDVDAQAEAPINANTVLPNGRTVDGPAQLRQGLFKDPAQFPQALTAKLMMYALGRELEYFDMPQV